MIGTNPTVANQAETASRRSAVVMDTYRRQPLTFARGDGVWLTAVDGKRYLDMGGGIAVNVLGHNHPRLSSAIAEQARELIHTSNLYESEVQVEAAELLVGTAFPSRVFFCNSGTEANEAAIKIARKWGRQHRNGASTIICNDGAFHGRTLGSLAATAEARYREPFTPLPGGFIHVAYDDVAAVAAAVDADTVAVLVEPIQGESGVIPLADNTLRALRRLCDEKNLLLIVDEVQTGMGRTGRWWCHQHAGITPDVMTIAKGLGGGVPIGAVLAAPRADVFEPGDHGSTFGGNQLATRAAATVLRTIADDHLVENARTVGDHLGDRLLALRTAGLPIVDVRGRGLMLGIVLDGELAAAATSACIDVGLLVIPVGTLVLRLLPPLVLSVAEADIAVERIAAALRLVVAPAGDAQ